MGVKMKILGTLVSLRNGQAFRALSMFIGSLKLKEEVEGEIVI